MNLAAKASSVTTRSGSAGYARPREPCGRQVALHCAVALYAWHPAYADLSSWIPASEEPSHRDLPVSVQPTVASYGSEIAGYDLSIDQNFRLGLPGRGILEGLGLHLSNSIQMSFADATGVRFFDPSVLEPGPSAALIDRDAFLKFLEREDLTCVWIIGGMKRVSGGRRHQEGWGGDRKYSSIYWIGANGFQGRHKTSDDKPTREQLARLVDTHDSSHPWASA